MLPCAQLGQGRSAAGLRSSSLCLDWGSLGPSKPRGLGDCHVRNQCLAGAPKAQRHPAQATLSAWPLEGALAFPGGHTWPEPHCTGRRRGGSEGADQLVPQAGPQLPVPCRHPALVPRALSSWSLQSPRVSFGEEDGTGETGSWGQGAGLGPGVEGRQSQVQPCPSAFGSA